MEISLRIDCTPTEARQMTGLPDLLPIYQCLALAFEDCLTAVVASLAATPGDGQPICHDRRDRRRHG